MSRIDLDILDMSKKDLDMKRDIDSYIGVEQTWIYTHRYEQNRLRYRLLDI